MSGHPPNQHHNVEQGYQRSLDSDPFTTNSAVSSQVSLSNSYDSYESVSNYFPPTPVHGYGGIPGGAAPRSTENKNVIYPSSSEYLYAKQYADSIGSSMALTHGPPSYSIPAWTTPSHHAQHMNPYGPTFGPPFQPAQTPIPGPPNVLPHNGHSPSYGIAPPEIYSSSLSSSYVTSVGSDCSPILAAQNEHPSPQPSPFKSRESSSRGATPRNFHSRYARGQPDKSDEYEWVEYARPPHWQSLDPPLWARSTGVQELLHEKKVPSWEKLEAYMPFKAIPSEERPRDFAVLRILDAPYDTTQQLIVSWLGVHANSIGRYYYTHTDYLYGIHILSDKATGKMTDIFIEMDSVESAEAVLRRFTARNLERSQRPKLLGNRKVQIRMESQEVLMRAVFPMSLNWVWKGQTPWEIPGKAFRVVVTGEELHMLLRVAQTLLKENEPNRMAQRAYEYVVTILLKFPWFTMELYTVQHRDDIFKQVDSCVRLLCNQINEMNSKKSPHIPKIHKLLENIVYAACRSGGFNCRQLFQLIRVANGPNTKIQWKYLPRFSDCWPLQIFTIIPGADKQLIIFFARLLKHATTNKTMASGIEMELYHTLNPNFRSHPFGGFRHFWPDEVIPNVPRLSAGEVARWEYCTLRSTFQRVVNCAQANPFIDNLLSNYMTYQQRHVPLPAAQNAVSSPSINQRDRGTSGNNSQQMAPTCPLPTPQNLGDILEKFNIGDAASMSNLGRMRSKTWALNEESRAEERLKNIPRHMHHESDSLIINRNGSKVLDHIRHTGYDLLDFLAK